MVSWLSHYVSNLKGKYTVCTIEYTNNCLCKVWFKIVVWIINYDGMKLLTWCEITLTHEERQLFDMEWVSDYKHKINLSTQTSVSS